MQSLSFEVRFMQDVQVIKQVCVTILGVSHILIHTLIRLP